jgi:hypothetical protein
MDRSSTSSEQHQVAYWLCQSSVTLSLLHVSSPSRTVERTEPSPFFDELHLAVASKNLKSSTLGGNYPLDLVLIRTIILGSS